jgi:tRNA(fMet)-specific endonuclease VapC
MKYLLDTNACIRILKGNSERLHTRIKSVKTKDICIPSIVRYELLYGAYKSNQPEKTKSDLLNFLCHFPSISFDDKAAEICGKIRADLDRKGTPIGPYDLMIAAISLSSDLILVTHNTREFQRIDSLELEDWES